MFFSRSASDFFSQILAGLRCIVNLVVVLVSCVGMNGAIQVNILAWIFLPYLFLSPTEVICQYTFSPPSLWWLCICLPVLLWGVGNTIFLNILHQNHRQPRWNSLGNCRVSIVLGSYFWGGVYKVLGIGQRNGVRLVLILGVHKSPWLPMQRFIHCAPCPWNFIYPWSHKNS